MIGYLRPLLVASAALLLLSGCGSDRDDAVTALVQDFAAAWDAQDGAAVCDLLAPTTRDEVESTTGMPCADGVLELDVPAPGDVRSIDVWGTAALARTAEDTVFVNQFDGGWKVLAAGCTPQGEKPYDCELKGA